jgi:hypothetical protein
MSWYHAFHAVALGMVTMFILVCWFVHIKDRQKERDKKRLEDAKN